MSHTSQTFCFFLETAAESELPTQGTLLGGRSGRYFEMSSRECLTNREGILSRPQKGDPAIRLETIRNKSRTLLLMASEPGLRVTVNGLPTASFSVLIPGDVLSVDEHIMHLSLLNRPYTGPPDESQLAARCGYCRVPIQDVADMRVYVCPTCQLPTHCQDAAGAARAATGMCQAVVPMRTLSGRHHRIGRIHSCSDSLIPRRASAEIVLAAAGLHATAGWMSISVFHG